MKKGITANPMYTLKTGLYITLISTAAFFFTQPRASLAQEVTERFSKKEAPVEVTADYLSYDKDTDTYYARGNVVLVQDKTTLMADTAILSMTAGVATASGNVRGVDEGGNTLSGDDMRMNIREKTVVLARGRIFFKSENIHITGDVIRKTGPETYDSENTEYTPCDCKEGERPAWSFTARKANIALGDYLTGSGAYFRVKGVPLLYTPYFSVPIKDDRETGFLTPKPGYSKLRGFVLENAFFWAISRNTDATFYFDINAARGLGKGAEYRYIRTRKSFGEMYFYHFKEKDIDRVRGFRKDVNNLSRPLTATDDRWQLKLLHNEVLPWDITLRASINVVSDDEYFIDFGKTGTERSLESLESNVSLSKSWSAYSLVAQFRYFDNLLIKDKSTILHKLPELTFTGSDRKILSTPFYYSIESSFTNFVRDEGVNGQRLDVHPRLSLPLSAYGYFDFTPSIAPRGTWYLVKDDPNGRYAERYIYDVKVDLTTTFARIFPTDYEELKALRHTIRPKLTYIYIPEKVQSNLPSFDAVDNLPAASNITYSLNNTLTGKLVEKGEKSYFDYLYLDLSQTFNIKEATRKIETPGDKRRPFSDITGELILTPSRWIKIAGKESYDVYNRWFNSYDAKLAASDKRGDSLSVTQRFLRAKTKYLEASARIKTVPAVDLTYLERFSFDQGKSLETSYGIEYRHQCWSAVLSYTEKLEEKIVFLTLNLQGLGRVAALEGRLQ